MKKIPTIFKRDANNMKYVVNEQNPECQWVFDGEGVATRKMDGTCCLVQDGKLFKRREIKAGEPHPSGFAMTDFDEITGKTVGWMPVDSDDASDKWHIEAFNACSPLSDGTYELVGPKIQGNPEHYGMHTLLKHSMLEQYPSVPRTFDGIKNWMSGKDIEGLVFHHPDGRMAKIKLRDFGIKRNATK